MSQVLVLELMSPVKKINLNYGDFQIKSQTKPFKQNY